MSELGLRQGLLLGMPPSSDPNQSRAVVLVVRHDDTGSFGLVINQPSVAPASALFSELGVTWRGPDAGRLWRGGPVSPQRTWLLHEAAPTQSGARLITSQISMSSTPDQLRRLALDPPRRLRVILGNLDWAAGQLAAAVSDGAVHADADLALVFDTPADALWDRLQAIGTRPATTGLLANVRRLLGLGSPLPKAILRRK